jgi:hypothetical protein
MRRQTDPPRLSRPAPRNKLRGYASGETPAHRTRPTVRKADFGVIRSPISGPKSETPDGTPAYRGSRHVGVGSVAGATGWLSRGRDGMAQPRARRARARARAGDSTGGPAGASGSCSPSASALRAMLTLPDSRSMRLPPELSPISSRVDCSRRFSSSMCLLAGLKRVSRPHCVIAKCYVLPASLPLVLPAVAGGPSRS